MSDKLLGVCGEKFEDEGHKKAHGCPASSSVLGLYVTNDKSKRANVCVYCVQGCQVWDLVDAQTRGEKKTKGQKRKKSEEE